VLTPEGHGAIAEYEFVARVFMSAMASWSPTATSSNHGRLTNARKP